MSPPTKHESNHIRAKPNLITISDKLICYETKSNSSKIVIKPRYYNFVQILLLILLDLTFVFSLITVYYFFRYNLNQETEFVSYNLNQYAVIFAIILSYQVLAIVIVLVANYYCVVALTAIELMALVKDVIKLDYLMASLTLPVVVLLVAFVILIKKMRDMEKKRLPTVVLTGVNQV